MRRLLSRFAELWADPQRRLTFLLLGGFSLATLVGCWLLPRALGPLVPDPDRFRFWLFLGRGVLLSLLALGLLAYFQLRDLRRDWDRTVPWFHNLVIGYVRHRSIR